MAKKYDPKMDPAAYTIPRGYVQCGGPNPDDPGCHRIVKESHVNNDGFCCFCEDRQSKSDETSNVSQRPDEPVDLSTVPEEVPASKEMTGANGE